MKLNVLHEREMPGLGGGEEIPVGAAKGPGPGPAPGPEADLGIEPAGEPAEPQGGGKGYPPEGYTIEQAKSQLDGILKRWMDLAGGFPEGEQRHNFMEIGERLEEIANTLERDFVQHEAQPPL